MTDKEFKSLDSKMLAQLAKRLERKPKSTLKKHIRKISENIGIECYSKPLASGGYYARFSDFKLSKFALGDTRESAVRKLVVKIKSSKIADSWL